MKAHSDDYFAGRYGPAEFRHRFTENVKGVKVDTGFYCCSYCGSVSIDDMLRVMQIPGTSYSGSDWKYGWPHKFYVTAALDSGEKEHLKFYSEHLADATKWQLEEWNKIVSPKVGIQFVMRAGELGYFAVPGYQTSGIV